MHDEHFNTMSLYITFWTHEISVNVRCIMKLANKSIDPKFVELTANVRKKYRIAFSGQYDDFFNSPVSST